MSFIPEDDVLCFGMKSQSPIIHCPSAGLVLQKRIRSIHWLGGDRIGNRIADHNGLGFDLHIAFRSDLKPDLPLFITTPARDFVVASERRRLGALRVICVAPRVGACLPNHCSEPRARARARRCSVERGREAFQEAGRRYRSRQTLPCRHSLCHSAWGFGPRLVQRCVGQWCN